MMIVRFAPSPTGYLHIGNARTALWNALHARRHGGQFILRLDDTDVERSQEIYAEAIQQDLAWLGIRWDRLERQSLRLDRYGMALERLKAAGLVYPAYETPDELERKRKRQQARGLPPVYDRASLKLTEAERTALEARGRHPHWRFRLSGATVEWQDGVRGPCHIDTGSLSDPVLVREDGTVLYTFASVVDDADMGVTDIIRGEDHVANTAVQIELFHALGVAPPRFAHHNLIVAASGEAMSKRTGALSIRSFRKGGADPMAVAAVAVLTGTSEPVRPLASLDDLVPLAELSGISRALTKFDPAEIGHLTTRLLHTKPYAAVRDRLAAAGIDGARAELFWDAVRANLADMEEAVSWWHVVNGPIAPHVRSDPELIETARRLLPPEPWDETTWGIWCAAVTAATGARGKALFLPLRLALTGLDHGPELKRLLPLIGRAEAERRLV
ncbi:MAG TPA: glutamate--tRNA ligase [Beijerinckiaceae bacterium]|nr:glutamate--tRNA ligase [Beijerinckiaceae bacterium]